MRSFWSDPYLWVHLAGLAAVPIFLEICLLGLAVSEPRLPMGLVLLVVGAIGVAPILWMQWQRPFSIFSLVILALPPEQLTVDQRRILQLFKTPIERGLAVFASIVMLVVLWRLTQIAPLATGAAAFLPIGWQVGLLMAAIAFLLSNLFFQVPVSVLRVLFTSQQQFAATDPYPIEQIARDFTLLGLQVPQILPQLTAEPAGPVKERPPVPATPAPVPQVEDVMKRGNVQDAPVAAGAALAASGIADQADQDAAQDAPSAAETTLIEGDLDELDEDWEDDFPATEIIADEIPAGEPIASSPEEVNPAPSEPEAPPPEPASAEIAAAEIEATDVQSQIPAAADQPNSSELESPSESSGLESPESESSELDEEERSAPRDETSST